MTATKQPKQKGLKKLQRKKIKLGAVFSTNIHSRSIQTTTDTEFTTHRIHHDSNSVSSDIVAPARIYAKHRTHHFTPLPSTAFRPTNPQRDEKGSDFLSTMTGGLADGNPLFSAGLGLSMLGVGLSISRKLALQGMVQLERHLTTSLEIASKDRSYHWVLAWCTAQTKGKSQHIGVETRVQHQGNGIHTTSFDFVPSPGKHFIWYKKNLIQIVREREKMSDLTTGNPFETVKLTVFSRNRDIFKDILQEAEQAALQKEEGRITIYMPMMTDWRPFGRPRPKRPIDSVILDEGISEFLQNDIKDFQKGGNWYKSKGIPHRRGYLLYGPPGSGKTSFIQSLAGEMGYSICVLSLNDRGLSDDRLLHLMTDVPPRSIILLEDIDAVFNQRESTYSVTFSGLLNALDGVTSIDERIVFMTTNHLEKLDPALVRPGRVDAKVYIGDSTAVQQRKMFKNFFPNVTETLDYTENASGSHTSGVLDIGHPTIELASEIVANEMKVDDFNTTHPGETPQKNQSDHEAGMEAERLKDNKPLHEHMSTANSEGFTEGLFNRAKESVIPEEVDTEAIYNEDGTTKRLSWDTVVDRVNPELLFAMDDDRPLSLALIAQRPQHAEVEAALEEYRKAGRAKLSPQMQNSLKTALDYDDYNQKLSADSDESNRQMQIQMMMKRLEQDLADENDAQLMELKKRQFVTDSMNRQRMEQGLKPIGLIDQVPENWKFEQFGNVHTPGLSKPRARPITVEKDEDEEVLATDDLMDLAALNNAGKGTAVNDQQNETDQEKKKDDKKPLSPTATAAIERARLRSRGTGTKQKPIFVTNTNIDQIATQTPPPTPKIDYIGRSLQQENALLYDMTETERLTTEFVHACSGAPISMAELQSLMLLYKDRPKMCIEGARRLVQEKKERMIHFEQQQQEHSNERTNVHTMKEQMYRNVHKESQQQQHAIASFKNNNTQKM